MKHDSEHSDDRLISDRGPPDQWLVQGHQGAMDGHGDDGQVEVVEHDVDVLMDSPLEVKVES